MLLLRQMDLLGGIVAANPCPPLPLQVKRIDSKTGEQIDGFASSHHVLMQAYVHAMRRDNAKDNKQREVTQTQLTALLQQSCCDNLKSPEKLYNSCCTFTRAYLHAFMPDRKVMDERFAPYSDIALDTFYSNPTVRASCEHLAGLMFYDEGGCETYENLISPLKTMPYSQVLSKYAELHIARCAVLPSIKEIIED